MLRSLKSVTALAVLVVVLVPLSLHAKCFRILPGLTEVEQLTRQYHSTVLLHCREYQGPATEFVIVRDGKAQEFSLDPRYRTASAMFLSNDGARVAYQGDLDKSHELAVFDPTSGRTSVLQSRAEPFSVFGWAPGGSELAISSLGSDQLEFVRVSDGAVVRTVRLQTHDSGLLLMSPDLQKAILLQPVGSSNRKDWWRMKMSVVDLTSGSKQYLVDGHDAVWSPQGDKIAYCDALESNCYMMSPSGGKPKHLFGAGSKFVAALFYSPSFRGPLVWSPDQRFLVFHEPAGLKGAENNAYVYDLQHKKKRKIFSGAMVSIEDWK
jgi:hypothetical protein